jgi:hypothetical protein
MRREWTDMAQATEELMNLRAASKFMGCSTVTTRRMARRHSGRETAGDSLAAIPSVGPSASDRNLREGKGECSVTPKSLSAGTKQGTRRVPTEKQLEALKPTQFKPGVSGNPGGRAAKPFKDALLRIVEKKIANDPEGRALIDAIAQQLVAKASKGDLASIREIADRIEGTPARSITLGGEGGGAIPFVNVSPAENERRIAELLAKAGAVGDGQIAD